MSSEQINSQIDSTDVNISKENQYMKLIHSINEFHNAKADVISKANMINGFAGMCFFTDPVTGYTM